MSQDERAAEIVASTFICGFCAVVVGVPIFLILYWATNGIIASIGVAAAFAVPVFGLFAIGSEVAHQTPKKPERTGNPWRMESGATAPPPRTRTRSTSKY